MDRETKKEKGPATMASDYLYHAMYDVGEFKQAQAEAAERIEYFEEQLEKWLNLEAAATLQIAKEKKDREQQADEYMKGVILG